MTGKALTLHIEVIRHIPLGRISSQGRLEESYDDQTLGEWFDFIDTIEAILEVKQCNITSTISCSTIDNISEYVGFYIENQGDKRVGAIELKLTDRQDLPDSTILVTVHGKSTQFHSYWQVEQYLRKELANILMNG